MMWAIILHGGAKEIEPDEAEAHRQGCLHALEAGRSVLQASGSAIEAVEAAIRELESDPTFNAGYGSALNADGEVEMCSAIMEGENFNVGAVSVIQGVRHPISVASAMLNEAPILLSGPGARRFAASKNLELCDKADLIPPKEKKASKTGSHDTWTVPQSAASAILRNRAAAIMSTTALAPSPFLEMASTSPARCWQPK
jgi:beta-aspartyl-peptidase (threonine type)